MSPLEHRLIRFGARINRVRANETARFAMAAALANWALLSLFDLWFRPREAGRLALSLIFISTAIAATILVIRVLRHNRTPAGVAALLEKHFPQLDNHLINRVLFALPGLQQSNWIKAYLAEPLPVDWSGLPFKELKNRRLRLFGIGTLTLAFLFLALPGIRYSHAWGVALQRVANPFCGLAPVTFTKIIEVTPGDGGAIQGEPVTITLAATGRAGQTVALELSPSDAARTTVQLGQFDASGGEQIFSYTIPRLTVPVKYRFIAGDAWPTPSHTLTPIPPLAIESISITVTPPDYTKLPVQSFDPHKDEIEIPQFSVVKIAVILNRPASGGYLQTGSPEPMPLASDGTRGWTGELTLDSDRRLQLTFSEDGQRRLRQPIAYTFLPDLPPSIRVTAPTTHSTLAPGEGPFIAFEAADDYGIDYIELEAIPPKSRKNAVGRSITRWTADGSRSISGEWNGEGGDLVGAAGFRLIAYDQKQPEPANCVTSAPIVFQQVLASQQHKDDANSRAQARKSIGQLIAQQRSNLQSTENLRQALPTFDEDDWELRHKAQVGIRQYAADLLAGGGQSLGAARVVLRKIDFPMAEAVSHLARLRTTFAADRDKTSQDAVESQRLVLRLLTLAGQQAQAGLSKTSGSGLMALVEALIKGQTSTLDSTKNAATTEPPPEDLLDALLKQQENLALDAAELIEIARRDAAMGKEGDSLQAMMNGFANQVERLKVRTDMLRAARALNNDQPAQAMPSQINATNSLHILHKYLTDWKAEETKQKIANAHEIIGNASETVKKLHKLQESIVDALRATETQGDKTDKQIDDDLVDEIVELKAQMADAMLKVATDLQALPDLDAANELVTDCYQVYEAMAQVEGSEKNKEARELGLAKEDYYLELMAQTGQKLDEMEMWLPNKPDDIKRNTENFDQAEIQSAIPQIGMPEELQDIISDLLEEQEELVEQTDDSTTNQGNANPAVGWGIEEGETVTYSASGKSGNRRPDHKDQDGRSQVGRAGMSDGEVMAKSGKINEGDENIDARRTQDSSQSGYVEEEDHGDAKATGGGKSSGYADDLGMAGTAADVRRESKVQQAAHNARQAQLAKLADTVYANAQMNGLRIPPGFNRARENMNHAAEAGRAGNITQMREFQERAIQDLMQAYSSLDAGLSGKSMGSAQPSYQATDAAVASTPDEAPAEYREMVSEYFKAIGELK